MNANLNVTIRRLMNVFIVLFLLLSGVAAYTQVQNQAFFNGPVLAHGSYDQRTCPPYDAPLRGRILDRNGVVLAQTVADPTAPCGYRRQYNQDAVNAGLGPLLGFDSPRYGTAGVEAAYNDQLAGVQHGQDPQQVLNHLLHKPQYGQDVYLTIDLNLQTAANNYYDASAIYKSNPNSPCQPANTSPPGSMIVENPQNGEILAMVSRPYFDPNKIDSPGYYASLVADQNAPLLNHATQALYDPGSTFKTVTLAAALDSGMSSLNTSFPFNEATDYVINGEHIPWVDYVQFHEWQGVAHFPLTLKDAYAFSDNTVFARQAVQLGSQTWLDYVRRFGIATPGTSVQPVGFDSAFRQSSAYNAQTNGKPTDFNNNLLAESGFGQGQLFITPMTMENVVAAVANDGTLEAPHVGFAVVPHSSTLQDTVPIQPTVYTGKPIFNAQTAQAVRQAMAAVGTYGTGNTVVRNGQFPSDLPAHQGGKTGTGQLEQGDPQTWWISLAPDDGLKGVQGPAKLAITLMKEHSGEGACQVFVTADTYDYALAHHIGPYK